MWQCKMRILNLGVEWALIQDFGVEWNKMKIQNLGVGWDNAKFGHWVRYASWVYVQNRELSVKMQD